MFVERAYNPAEPAFRPVTGHGGEMTEFEDTFPDIGSMKVSAVPEEETS